MYSQSLTKMLRPMFERGCLLGWMFLLMVNTVVIGLAVELITVGAALSSYHVYLINEQTIPLLLFGVLAGVNFFLIARMWTYGVDHLNFEIHENAFNRMVEVPESWSNLFEALLDETTIRSQELETMIRLIEEAPGPVERQDRRAEAKAWLQKNRAQLSPEDQELVRRHLAYLG